MNSTHFTPNELERYDRHLSLKEIGSAGQMRLKKSKVLCIGVGGLGSPLLMYLAAAGVGTLGIVDPDRVELSNLQRQTLFGCEQIGTPKVEAARKKIYSLNPNVEVLCFHEALTKENALQIIETFDVIADCTDNFPARYLINDACVLLGKPLVYASITQFTGQASLFNFQDGPNYRDLYPEPPPPGRVPTCAEGGVLGVLPGLMGNIQATEVLKVLLGIGKTLSGRLLIFDALNMTFKTLTLKKSSLRTTITELQNYERGCVMFEKKVKTITAEELQSKLQSKDTRPFIVDVRQPEETEISALPLVDLFCPHDEIDSVISQIPKDRDVIIYCRSGRRSEMACKILMDDGFENVINLEGGILAWMQSVQA